jgi:predicted N-acetyltransferase YhbS
MILAEGGCDPRPPIGDIEETESMLFRELERDEIELVWTIDRRELVEAIYHLEHGCLVLLPERCDIQGWPPGEAELYTPVLLDCFDRGGTFLGAFEGGALVGIVVLECRFIGKPRDQLQLKFLHVGRDYRKRGLGRALFERMVEWAQELGARRLYISATPSENTVDFYLHLGCVVAEDIDEALLELEPEDIHLEYTIPPTEQPRSTQEEAGHHHPRP